MGWGFALVFLIPLLLALSISPLTARLGLKLGILDRPGGRRRHVGRVSRLGGVALYLAFTSGLLLVLFLPSRLLPPRQDPREVTRLTGLLLGTGFVFLFGLLDDRFRFPPCPQYAAQFIASLIAIAFVIHIKHVNSPFTTQFLLGPDGFPWPLVGVFTALWIMGMMNTVNFLDGLDGLAAGVGAILCAVLAVHMIRQNQLSVALLPLALLGATLGFIPHNFHPAKVFMGSSGSYALGFALGALGIIGGARMATVLLAMGLPILDVAWQIVRRRRLGRPIGLSDRGHLHFRLQDMGYSQRAIVLAYYLFCALFGLLALLLSSRLYKLLALVVMGLAVGLVLLWLSRCDTQDKDTHGPSAP
jgi:UDP-GlcNAc:undecaprenyl-phosphate GlcNAc-1-phosphate transferase